MKRMKKHYILNYVRGTIDKSDLPTDVIHFLNLNNFIKFNL